jgi:hypothetical protein
MKRSRKSNIKRKRSIRHLSAIKGGRPPKRDTYQAKLIDLYDFIGPTDKTRDEIEKMANEYAQKEENAVNIGDILFCGTPHDRQEYGFYIVLPDGENKVAKCLGEGWGAGWIVGGVIDQKDILNEHNVKYDNMFSTPSGVWWFENDFLGEFDKFMPQQIRDELRKNNLLS